MAKQKYERGKLSLRGTKAAKTENETEKAVEELNNTPIETAAPTKVKRTTTRAKKTPTKAKKTPIPPLSKTKTQRFTVDFPEDRYFNFKMEALKRRTTVKNMLLEAMEKTFGL